MSKTLVLDNGCSTIKAGYVTDEKPRSFPNSIMKSKADRKRVFIADEIEECKDHSSIYFSTPAEKGYIVNWDVEQKIWDRVFNKNVLDVAFNDTRVVVTDPIYNVPAIKDLSIEILFEQYGFHSVAKTSSSTLIALADIVSEEYKDELCCLVVDSGYSFTHIIPYHNGIAIRDAITRIDVGGKLLTNLLKEWSSYRHLNVMEETYVMNECKEDICYVASDFREEMKLAKSTNRIRRRYALPDFLNHSRGFVCQPETTEADVAQVLDLNIERFCVPETLFSPSDIGISQMGIPEAINHAVSKCLLGARGRLLKNIILCGGNTLFSGYRDRVKNEVRSFADVAYDVCLRPVDDPVTHAWSCGRLAVLGGALDDRFVSKEKYEEHGTEYCRQRYLCYIV